MLNCAPDEVKFACGRAILATASVEKDGDTVGDGKTCLCTLQVCARNISLNVACYMIGRAVPIHCKCFDLVV